MRRCVSLVVLLGVLSACRAAPESPRAVLYPNGTATTVRVEVADDLEEMGRGLMGREELADDEGMLFVWSDTLSRRFWMKDTLIALDLIAIEEGRVVSIETMVPCLEDPCLRYETVPAMTVLEVRGGWAADHGLLVGDRASLVYPSVE